MHSCIFYNQGFPWEREEQLLYNSPGKHSSFLWPCASQQIVLWFVNVVPNWLSCTTSDFCHDYCLHTVACPSPMARPSPGSCLCSKRAECSRVCSHCLGDIVFITLNHSHCNKHTHQIRAIMVSFSGAVLVMYMLKPSGIMSVLLIIIYFI